LREFHWFCLDHVRAYNAGWDFYKGMGPDEIEACLRADTSWQRPTWPLGRIGGSGRFDPEILRDPLGVLGAEAPSPRRKAPENDTPWLRWNCAPATRIWLSSTTRMPPAATSRQRSV